MKFTTKTLLLVLCSIGLIWPVESMAWFGEAFKKKTLKSRYERTTRNSKNTKTTSTPRSSRSQEKKTKPTIAKKKIKKPKQVVSTPLSTPKKTVELKIPVKAYIGSGNEKLESVDLKNTFITDDYIILVSDKGKRAVKREGVLKNLPNEDIHLLVEKINSELESTDQSIELIEKIDLTSFLTSITKVELNDAATHILENGFNNGHIDVTTNYQIDQTMANQMSAQGVQNQIQKLQKMVMDYASAGMDWGAGDWSPGAETGPNGGTHIGGGMDFMGDRTDIYFTDDPLGDGGIAITKVEGFGIAKDSDLSGLIRVTITFINGVTGKVTVHKYDIGDRDIDNDGKHNVEDDDIDGDEIENQEDTDDDGDGVDDMEDSDPENPHDSIIAQTTDQGPSGSVPNPEGCAGGADSDCDGTMDESKDNGFMKYVNIEDIKNRYGLGSSTPSTFDIDEQFMQVIQAITSNDYKDQMIQIQKQNLAPNQIKLKVESFINK